MKRSRPHPTLADVAERAGVGKTTVSRVINGAYKVGPETLERVNKVIRELGYHPSQAARSLKGERSKTIGLILPRIADPFFAAVAEAAQAVARSHGYLLIVAATNYDPQTEVEQVYTLLRQRVDGILLAPMDSASKMLATWPQAHHVSRRRCTALYGSSETKGLQGRHAGSRPNSLARRFAEGL